MLLLVLIVTKTKIAGHVAEPLLGLCLLLQEILEPVIEHMTQLGVDLAQDVVVFVLAQLLEVIVDLHHLDGLFKILHLNEVIDTGDGVLDDFL